jgi:hypothetical protein
MLGAQTRPRESGLSDGAGENAIADAAKSVVHNAAMPEISV